MSSGASSYHIIHVITRFIRGGADENTLLTCNGQAEAGHRVTLICGASYDEAMVGELHPDVTFISEPLLIRDVSLMTDIRCLRALTQRFRAMQPDIVHTHESKAGIIGRLAAHAADVPVVVHGVHILAFMSASPFMKRVYTFLERVSGRVTHGYIHVSQTMLDECRNRNIGLQALHKVVPSGMVLSRYTHAVSADHTEYTKIDQQLPDNPVFLVMSGTLEPRKRVAEFLAVFKDIVEQVPNAVLVVGGDGSERARIEATIIEHDLHNHVILLGYTTKLPAWIAASAIGVHAALHEGLPRVVIQYIAAGKPVVATELKGIERVITDNENGFIVDDLDTMREPIVTLLTDEHAYDSAAKAAMQRDMTPWNHQHMVSEISAMYDALHSKRAVV